MSTRNASCMSYKNREFDRIIYFNCATSIRALIEFTLVYIWVFENSPASDFTKKGEWDRELIPFKVSTSRSLHAWVQQWFLFAHEVWKTEWNAITEAACIVCNATCTSYKTWIIRKIWYISAIAGKIRTTGFRVSVGYFAVDALVKQGQSGHPIS